MGFLALDFPLRKLQQWPELEVFSDAVVSMQIVSFTREHMKEI